MSFSNHKTQEQKKIREVNEVVYYYPVDQRGLDDGGCRTIYAIVARAALHRPRHSNNRDIVYM